MDEKAFIERCRELVEEYAIIHLDKSDHEVTFDVFVVWQVKVLQNNKA